MVGLFRYMVNLFLSHLCFANPFLAENQCLTAGWELNGLCVFLLEKIVLASLPTAYSEATVFYLAVSECASFSADLCKLSIGLGIINRSAIFLVFSSQALFLPYFLFLRLYFPYSLADLEGAILSLYFFISLQWVPVHLFFLATTHLGCATPLISPVTSSILSRDVEAEAEAGSGGSGLFSVEAEAQKFYRFRFHIGYLTSRVTWLKSFVHFPMWIKR